MVKVFKLNDRNKIELTQEELEALLNEAWKEGEQYGHNNYNDYLYWYNKGVIYPPDQPYYNFTTVTCDTKEVTACLNTQVL